MQWPARAQKMPSVYKECQVLLNSDPFVILELCHPKPLAKMHRDVHKHVFIISSEIEDMKDSFPSQESIHVVVSEFLFWSSSGLGPLSHLLKASKSGGWDGNEPMRQQASKEH